MVESKATLLSKLITAIETCIISWEQGFKTRRTSPELIWKRDTTAQRGACGCGAQAVRKRGENTLARALAPPAGGRAQFLRFKRRSIARSLKPPSCRWDGCGARLGPIFSASIPDTRCPMDEADQRIRSFVGTTF